jgi:hypothetical protein
MGSLRVVTITGGPSSDPHDYTYKLDDRSPQPIGPTASVTVDGLTAGTHSVLLGGLASNCTPGGTNPRTVTVVAGSTVEVAFTVTCEAPAIEQWTPMRGTDSYLGGVWGSSASNVLAVGDSSILHYDGRDWSTQSHHHGVRLEGVWGSSANDAFAVGSAGQDPAGLDGAILHYDGSAWTAMQPLVVGSDNSIAQAFYLSVWGSSGNDVFAVGETYAGFSQVLVAHYDGTGWSRMRLPREDEHSLTDVFGTSANDVWVGGVIVGPSDAGVGTGFVFHYDGSEWTYTPIMEGLDLRGIWAGSPTNVFSVGEVNGSAAVFHYDGSTWSPMSVSSTGPLNAVWGRSAKDVFAVGERGILHYDGRAWTTMGPSQSLNDVWGASPTDIFAVGNYGAILHGTP